MAGPFACFSRPALIIQLQLLADKFFADSAIAAPVFDIGKIASIITLLRCGFVLTQGALSRK
jgi:hypothetical protein